MAARAPLDATTAGPCSVTLRLISPDRITLARSVSAGTMLAASNAARSISSAFTFWRSVSVTSARVFLIAERKPTFGRRRCSGTWPPSKPTLW
jgi:hypothetical protein